MNSATTGNCRRTECSNTIPFGLATEQLCLDHFLDEALVRTEQALDSWRRGVPVNSNNLEWLLADALAVVNNLEESADSPNPSQRDRMLELLLNIANLHEYVAHHSVDLRRIS